MDPIISTIGLNIISNFLSDVIKRAAGERVFALDEAIESTARAFEGIEGLRESLGQWLQQPDVITVLRGYVEGEVGRTELQIPDLIATLLARTQFYMPEHSPRAAEKIVSTFLVKVRAAYLQNPRVSTLHIANRLEGGFDDIQRSLQQLKENVESAGGLKPALQKHFDAAMASLEAHDYPAAKTLFESLLVEVELSPSRDRTLERRIHASLGKTLSSFGENDSAVRHYRKAAELDEDPVRAAVNSAVADLIEKKPEDALCRLESVSGLEVSKVYEYWAARVGALLTLKRYSDAIEIAQSICITGKDAQRLELIGLCYRESGSLEEAEKAFGSALDLDSGKPELHYSYAEVLFRPVMVYRNKQQGLPLPSNLREKLDTAATHLEKAATQFRSQGRNRAALEAEAALAVVRSLDLRYAEAIRLLEPVVITKDVTSVVHPSKTGQVVSV